MKPILQVTIMVLLSLVVSCTKHTQPVHASREKETQAPPTISPAATDRGTPAEAQAMLRKAVEHYNDVGRKQALADFTGRKALGVTPIRETVVSLHTWLSVRFCFSK